MSNNRVGSIRNKLYMGRKVESRRVKSHLAKLSHPRGLFQRVIRLNVPLGAFPRMLHAKRKLFRVATPQLCHSDKFRASFKCLARPMAVPSAELIKREEGSLIGPGDERLQFRVTKAYQSDQV